MIRTDMLTAERLAQLIELRKIAHPDRADLTLDEAKRRFVESERSNIAPAADLLAVATTYWLDGMIEDDTYADIVILVATDLRETLKIV